MRHGFSLIELSIVLVIIALVASGIFVGKSLFEASEARAIMSEANSYTTAYKEFVDKYQAVPGDMNNAYDIWGIDPGGCPLTATNTVVKEGTCNGDGNGMIGNWRNGSPSSDMEYEWFRAWQHLANAGFIGGSYTGVKAAGSSTATSIGINVPQSKSGKGGWTLLYMVSNGTDETAFYYTPGIASHVLIYGAQTTNSFTDSPIISPQQAKAIDAKVDDGMPYTGSIRVKRNTTDCSTNAAASSDYFRNVKDSKSTALSCQLLFIMGM